MFGLICEVIEKVSGLQAIFCLIVLQYGFLEHNSSSNIFTTITPKHTCDTYYALNAVKDGGIISLLGLICEVIEKVSGL